MTVALSVRYCVSPHTSAMAPPKKPVKTTAPLRILCLHGSRQTGQIFSDRVSRLASKLRALKLADTVFIDGPVELPLEPEDTGNLRAWYDGNDIESALAAIDMNWHSGKAFDGVLGFSQGALVAATWPAVLIDILGVGSPSSRHRRADLHRNCHHHQTSACRRFT